MYKLIILLILSGSSYAQPIQVKKSCIGVGTRDGMGSGTIISREGKQYWLITNKHVTVQENKLKVWIIEDGKRYLANKVIESTTEIDLSLVSFEADINLPVIKLADEAPKDKDELYHFGRGTGPQKGTFHGWGNFTMKYGVVMTTSLFSVCGDSGSGIFNKKGELVGVHFAVIGDSEKEYPDRVSGDVSLKDVKEFIKNNLK